MQPAWRSLKGASHSDPIQVASSVFEQRASRARRALRRRSGELDTPPADGWGGQRESVDTQDGVEELRRILQGTSTPSPRTFLGVSPPARCSGALNPQATDRCWRSCAHQCSSSNLQALREIDGQGASFLELTAHCEEGRLAADSPEQAWLPAASLAPTKCSAGRSGSSCGSSRLSTPRVCQTGFVIS